MEERERNRGGERDREKDGSGRVVVCHFWHVRILLNTRGGAAKPPKPFPLSTLFFLTEAPDLVASFPLDMSS